MSEPKPVWQIDEDEDEAVEDDRITIVGLAWQATIRNTGIPVADVLRYLTFAEDNCGAYWEKWPELEPDDMDAVLNFAADAVDALVMRVASEENGQVMREVEEAVCYDTPPTPLYLRVMAGGAGTLMFALAVLVLWFLVQQAGW